ncbi:MAG: alpha/beta hydrolase family protein [bacterium]
MSRPRVGARRLRVCLSALLLTMAGCQANSENSQAAYVAVLTEAQIQEVARIIQRDLVLTTPPLLAAEAFQHSSVLVLTPALANTPQGKLASGRSMAPPHRFALLSDGKDCLLQNIATGRKHVLSFGCLSAKPAASSRDVWISSRQTRIPVTLVAPAIHSQPVPLVLLIHGHGGTRHEAGGFTRVADLLAGRGMASVRMDFPGSGDSREPFSANNLSNMLADIASAQRFAETQLTIDPTRIGLLGFSMGGRLALLYSQTLNIKSMALWAPAATDGASSMVAALGGQARYENMKKQAHTAGAVPFTTSWGQQQLLGYQWFTDLENSKPGVAIRQFRGDLLVLYGNLDQVVKPAVAAAVYDQATRSASRRIHVVEGADHGLGLFSNQPELTAQAITQTADFFAEHL